MIALLSVQFLQNIQVTNFNTCKKKKKKSLNIAHNIFEFPV